LYGSSSEMTPVAALASDEEGDLPNIPCETVDCAESAGCRFASASFDRPSMTMA